MSEKRNENTTKIDIESEKNKREKDECEDIEYVCTLPSEVKVKFETRK